MGFSGNDYDNDNESNENPWEGGGFNPDDYLQNIDKMNEENQNNLGLGVQSSLWGDFENAQNQWKDTMQGYKDYHERTQKFGEKVSDYWDDFEEGQTTRNQNQKTAMDAYDARLQKVGKGYQKQTSDFAAKLMSITNQGTAKASQLSADATAKYAQMETDLEDYSQAALSAQIQGETRKAKNQTMSRVEEARRQGAPQTVLDQIEYQGNQELSQGLQGGIANSQMQWQALTQEAGGRHAQALMSQGALEGQLTSIKAGSAEAGMNAELQGSQFASQMDLTGAEAQKNLAMSIEEQAGIRAQERMMSELSAEQVGIAGDLDWAEAIRNNPAVSASTVYSTLLSMVTMPGYDKVSQMYLPGTAPSSPYANKRAQMTKQGFNVENWSDDDFDSHNRWGFQSWWSPGQGQA